MIYNSKGELKTMNKLFSNKKTRILPFFLLDIISLFLSYGVTFLLFYILKLDFDFHEFLLLFPSIMLVNIIVFSFSGVYRMLNAYFGLIDFIRLFISIMISNVIVAITLNILQITFISNTAFVFIIFSQLLLFCLVRIAGRLFYYFKTSLIWGERLSLRTIIIGAGMVGEQVVKEIYANKKLNNLPVAFLDDNEEKQGSRLSGIKVIGTVKELAHYIDELEIDEIIIAINNYPKDKLQEIANIASIKNVKIKKFEGMKELTNGDTVEKVIIGDIKIEDLLNRPEICLSDESITDFIKDEVVLVTGGGGSIGSELCRQIASYSPKHLIIFDIYENNAYDIQQELLRTYKKANKPLNLTVWIGSVYNETRLRQVFETFKPTLVFHAAAYKHVPLMEDSAVEAIRTNVFGTFNTAKLAKEFNVKKFVMISSDKAVRSTNIMGASKRYAELIVQALQKDSDFTKYSAVRFGNVLGSNGSVIPLFKKQIEDGGPVTVTHKEITRYFMTIPEAVGLILQSGTFAQGGEVFILDMGEPVKIIDLAEKMIRLNGYTPYEDIKIEFTGLRPGEKLYEELLVDLSDKSIKKTANNKIFIEIQRKITLEELKLKELEKTFNDLENDSVKDVVASVITTYKRDK